jgi:hypothetical protein
MRAASASLPGRTGRLLHRCAARLPENAFGIGASPSHGQTTVKNGARRLARKVDRSLTCGDVEPMTGIEPAYSAWEADVLPLNYIGKMAVTSTNADHSRPV